MSAAPQVILASGSVTRRRLLENAGVVIGVDPASIDEGAVKTELRAQQAPVEAAAAELAARKAAAVAPRHAGALVIGADQMLESAGDWFDKPADRAGAAAQLARLAGRRHRLVSAAVVIENGREVWRSVDTAVMHMRPLSADFIASYLDRAGAGILSSVGAYQLEGLGAQLFDRVEGDYFTVLGLPLLKLLEFLRGRKAIPA